MRFWISFSATVKLEDENSTEYGYVEDFFYINQVGNDNMVEEDFKPVATAIIKSQLSKWFEPKITEIINVYVDTIEEHVDE